MMKELSNEAIILAQEEILSSGDQLKPGQFALANETRFNEAYFNQPLTAYAVG